MATGVCGQGAIQSNEIALGREKKRKIMTMESGRAGETKGDRVVGNITSFCVPPQDHGNSLICTTSVPADPVTGFFQLVKTEL